MEDKIRDTVIRWNKPNPDPNGISLNNPDTGPKIDAAVAACKDPTLRSLRDFYITNKNGLDDFIDRTGKSNGTITIDSSAPLPPASNDKSWVMVRHYGKDNTNMYVQMTPQEAQEFKSRAGNVEHSQESMHKRNNELMKESGITTSPLDVINECYPAEQRKLNLDTPGVAATQSGRDMSVSVGRMA